MDIKDVSGLGSAFDFAKGIMDRFWPKQATETEKLEALSEIAPLIQDRDDSVVNAKRDIIVSELNQQDKFTKRARPSVVYMGLLFIGLVHVLFPIVIKIITICLYMGSSAEAIKALEASPKALEQLNSMTQLSLPGEFWAAWSTVVGIWSIGRSFEKNGIANKVVSMITGAKQ